MRVEITQLDVPAPLAPPGFARGIAPAATQAAATQLEAVVNVLEGGTAGGYVQLQAIAGGKQRVINRTNASANVLPSGGAQIETFGIGVASQIAAGGAAWFDFDGTSTWFAS